MTPQPTIFAGEDLTYALTVTNAGPIIAARAELKDATPPNTAFVFATAPPGWTITQQPPVGGTGPTSSRKSEGVLDSQAFLSVLRNVSTLRDVFADPPMFTIVVRVNPGGARWHAHQEQSDAHRPSDPNSHTAETTVTVIGRADISITKTDPQMSTVPGAVLTYTLVARNARPNAVTGARVS